MKQRILLLPNDHNWASFDSSFLDAASIWDISKNKIIHVFEKTNMNHKITYIIMIPGLLVKNKLSSFEPSSTFSLM